MPTQKQKKKQTNKLTGKSPRRAWRRIRLHYSGSIVCQHRNLLVIVRTTEWFMSQTSHDAPGQTTSLAIVLCANNGPTCTSWDAINESFPVLCECGKSESLREAMWKAMGCLGCSVKEEIKRWRTSHQLFHSYLRYEFHKRHKRAPLGCKMW